MTADGTKPTEEHRSYRRVCNGMQQCTNPAQSLPNSSMFTPCYTMFTFTILSSLKADVENAMNFAGKNWSNSPNFSRRFYGTKNSGTRAIRTRGAMLKNTMGKPLSGSQWIAEFGSSSVTLQIFLF